VTTLLTVILLLLGNAFFVAAEFSLIASRRTALEPATSRRAQLALRAMEQIPLMIAGSQLGVTVCSLGLGAIAEPALAQMLRGPAQAIGLPESFAHPIAFIIGLGVVVFAHTVLGEMVPKNFTLVSPEAAVLWLGPPVLGFCMVTKPLLVTMKWLSRMVLRIWRVEATDAVKTVYTAEELAGLVAESRTEGLLDKEEHARITGALALHGRTAAQALRPWPDVTTVEDNVSPAALEVLASSSGLSRFPVVHKETGWVRGFVHIKDVLAVIGPARRAGIQPSLIRPLPVVPPDRTLGEALLAMRRERVHIVLVGTAAIPVGLLTLDDVLREVVGVDTPTRTVASP
jgi:CBS domain containing-hemolysin-like protein